MGNFEDLIVWQESVELVNEIYFITRKHPLNKDFSLCDQLRRSAVSIPSNISEGEELSTDRQSIRHFYIAKGSCGELYTQLLVSYNTGLLTREKFEELGPKAKILSRRLNKLIRARESTK